MEKERFKASSGTCFHRYTMELQLRLCSKVLTTVTTATVASGQKIECYLIGIQIIDPIGIYRRYEKNIMGYFRPLPFHP